MTDVSKPISRLRDWPPAHSTGLQKYQSDVLVLCDEVERLARENARLRSDEYLLMVEHDLSSRLRKAEALAARYKTAIEKAESLLDHAEMFADEETGDTILTADGYEAIDRAWRVLAEALGKLPYATTLAEVKP